MGAHILALMPSAELGREIGGYRLEEFIARGGMGAVYIAQQVRLERRVALKVIAPELAQDPAFRERFERERASRLARPPADRPGYDTGEDCRAGRTSRCGWSGARPDVGLWTRAPLDARSRPWRTWRPRWTRRTTAAWCTAT